MRFPPGFVQEVAGAGQLFFRDSGPGSGPAGTLLLLHGWAVTSDINFLRLYGPLETAGFRVIALDMRGHGRGLRAGIPFRLADCAEDAAALLRHLDLGPSLVHGYSLGGSVAQLLAHNHPELVAGLVLGATRPRWPPRGGGLYRAGMKVLLGLAPDRGWRFASRRVGWDVETARWAAGELSRSSPAAILEANADARSFDSRAWVGSLPMPLAVIITTRDRSVSTDGQREFAEVAPRAALSEVPLGHDDLVRSVDLYLPALLAALDSVGGRNTIPR